MTSAWVLSRTIRLENATMLHLDLVKMEVRAAAPVRIQDPPRDHKTTQPVRIARARWKQLAVMRRGTAYPILLHQFIGLWTRHRPRRRWTTSDPQSLLSHSQWTWWQFQFRIDVRGGAPQVRFFADTLSPAPRRRSAHNWTHNAPAAFRPGRITRGVLFSINLPVGLVTLCAISCNSQPAILSPYGSTIGLDGRARPRPHDGVDIQPTHNNEVIASADGVVDRVAFQPQFGYMIAVRHDRVPVTPQNGGAPWWTSYVHIRSPAVEVGDRVTRGDTLGVVGTFPASGGISHVHWQICRDKECHTDMTVDPTMYLAGCYVPDRQYDALRLVLTYPVRC